MSAVIETVRPGTGPKTGSGGTASRTNVNWNRAAKVVGAAGKGNALLGAGLGAWRIKNAEDKAREAAIVSGEVGGTLAGALLGAKLGLLGGPFAPYTSAAGALVGGIGGGLLGGDKVEDFYDWVTD